MTDPQQGQGAGEQAPQQQQQQVQQQPEAGSATPDSRPRPAYGEYAPEGWEWKPEGVEPSQQAPSGVAAAAAQGPAQVEADRLAGVPHNLGTSSQSQRSGAQARPASPAAGTASEAGSPRQQPSGEPVPYRAEQAPVAPPMQAPQYQQGVQQAQQRPQRMADVVITIALLVIGGFGALTSAQSMFGLSRSFTLMADVLGIADFSQPAWLGTLGTVSGLVIIALYAVALIFSIQRMRARKLAFWVPLTAGAIAGIGAVVVTSIALVAVPELMNALSDPDAMQKMLDYVSTMQN